MDDNPTELRSLAAKSSCIQLVYEWASCEMPAIDTWKNEKGYGTCPDHDWLIWQMNEMRLPSRPVIPDLVRDQLEYHLTSILNQVTEWIRYHHEKKFFHDEPASPLKEYLLKLIWKPDRSIDYAASAKNVLADATNFNAMEKYRFACTYCFPEDVCNLRDMAEVAIDWRFDAEPFLVYWSKYLTNQLHTITLPAYASIEVVMFAKALKDYDLWRPAEYFFAKLNSAARLLQCKNVLSHKEGKHQNEVLALLKECEKDTVYPDNMMQMIRNYKGPHKVESIRQIYALSKGKLNSKNFARLIIELVALSTIDHRNFNAVTPLLMEIWNDACGVDEWATILTELQSDIAEHYVLLIEDDAKDVFDFKDQYHRPLEFFRVLAAQHNPKHFIKSNFHWLVTWQPFASVVKLIDEFQLDAEDVEELKKDLRQSDKMEDACRIYLECGEFDEFDSFLSFCYSDDDANRIAFQRNFLMDDDGSEALGEALYRVDWKTVYEFINNVFRDTVELASTCTTLAILGVLENERCFLKEMLHRGEASKIIECVLTFVPHYDNLSRAKELCIDSLSDYLHHHVNFVFKSIPFENVLVWSCAETEAGVSQFKKNLRVSQIFITQLRNCVDGYTFKVTDSMEEFLHWYYPVESERRAFKLEMIYSYGEFKTIAEFLKQRRYRRCMLEWFFENDAREIMEFATKIYIV